jgi:hypothetical protein
MKYKFFTSLFVLSAFASLYGDTSLPSAHEETFANPSSRFQVQEGYNIFLTADFLWWSANTDGLYYAQKNFGSSTSANPPNGSFDFSGHLARVKQEWGPGARVGLGGNMPYDEWDIYLNWTWFQADPHSSTRQKNEGPLLVLWSQPDISGANLATRASAKWDLTLNVLDLEMGRSFWVGKHLAIRPFMGIRGAWIDQEFKIHYDYALTPEVKGKLKLDSDFEGVGARLGLDLRFALHKGWSLYGVAAGSLLYGDFDCDFHQKADSFTIARTDDNFHKGVSTIQMGLGVRWDTYFSKRRFHFGVSAGWEQNIWYGVTQFNHYLGSLSTGTLVQDDGDLTLQGGTLSARFDF